MSPMSSAGLVSLLLLVFCGAAAAGPRSVQIDELTSTELRARIAAGTTTVLVPIGGTEQNGAHMVLGKHNVRAAGLAQRIAERLGDAVVAPVLAYVPEGAIDPPAGHMRYAGTISIGEDSFEALLDSAARSFCRHGLHDVFLLGDHGGYQRSLERVQKRGGRPAGCRVHALGEYYRAVQTDYVAALKARGHTQAAIGNHAGLADTALALAVDPALVRSEALASAGDGRDGVSGDPRAATAELGRLGIERIVDVSVETIRKRRAGR
jgi:creatinine amidohydrolase/Fe(II)-dependent formamide hydrolase-like protein